MKILLSNDDGYLAEGIRNLYYALSERHQVTIVAPDRNRSATSSALTLNAPLKPHRSKEGFIYLENATPVDCVHLALTGLLDFEPDMVIAGINSGANLADDTIYSGTVAAAMEGRFLGRPSIAVSCVEAFEFDRASAATLTLLEKMADSPLPNDTILNVNIPGQPGPHGQFEITRLGRRHKSQPVIESHDARGEVAYWIGPVSSPSDDSKGTDFHAVQNNLISVTPLTPNLTRTDALESLEKWL